MWVSAGIRLEFNGQRFIQSLCSTFCRRCLLCRSGPRSSPQRARRLALCIYYIHTLGIMWSSAK